MVAAYRMHCVRKRPADRSVMPLPVAQPAVVVAVPRRPPPCRLHGRGEVGTAARSPGGRGDRALVDAHLRDPPLVEHSRPVDSRGRRTDEHETIASTTRTRTAPTLRAVRDRRRMRGFRRGGHVQVARMLVETTSAPTVAGPAEQLAHERRDQRAAGSAGPPRGSCRRRAAAWTPWTRDDRRPRPRVVELELDLASSTRCPRRTPVGAFAPYSAPSWTASSSATYTNSSRPMSMIPMHRSSRSGVTRASSDRPWPRSRPRRSAARHGASLLDDRPAIGRHDVPRPHEARRRGDRRVGEVDGDHDAVVASTASPGSAEVVDSHRRVAVRLGVDVGTVVVRRVDLVARQVMERGHLPRREAEALENRTGLVVAGGSGRPSMPCPNPADP